MEKYNFKEIEPKWQKYWEEHPELYIAKEEAQGEKQYILDMFPYPSGEGLHVGHVESYTATDIISRYLRMNGKNVLRPQGWDAFGLPAENYAIKTKIHPAETTKKSIENFKRQMNKMGFAYDWSREVNSSDPEYYKWTQWFFLLLYKNGLAYKKKAKANWCPSCQTVLANEQVVNGKCERCGTEVIQKDLEQWFFKITDFIEENKKTSGLISGLDKIDWPDSTKAAQKNWIGRSEGAQFKMPIAGSNLFIEVYTTRLDTAFGITYAVAAPEHPIIGELKEKISNWNEVEKYLDNAKKKTDLERMEEKVKTGVEFKGIKVINPFNKEEIPLFVADYVLSQYGTGAVMAVPAHDERDFEFAKKYKLPIKQSIALNYQEYKTTVETLEALKEIYAAAKEQNIKFWLLGGLACAFYAGIIYREHADLDLITKDEASRDKFVKLLEKLGFKKVGEKKISENLVNFIYQRGKIEVDIGPNQGEFGLTDDFEEETKFLGKYKARVLSRRFIKSFKEYQLKNRNKEKDRLDYEYLNGKVFIEDGMVVNSDKYSGLASQEAREKMADWLEKNKLGERKINYKIRDWLVSRQRYWGAPIPIIYCEHCGTIPVPEKDLPVMLPDDVDFKPTGESPLKYSKKFQNVKCPHCGAKARRESDTMDTFVCSSWYYFRYADPKNEKEFASKKQVKKWLPVDLYVGGAEHNVLHLLYSRFFTKVLHNLGHIDFDEPFLKLRHQGIILAEDGRKMSKSLGNVINPDDIVNEFGADSLRLFEMFMGPLEDMKPWQTNGIIGMQRFLEKLYNFSMVTDLTENSNGEVSILLNKTIKKVKEDIENLKFNTAISSMMIFLNKLYKTPEELKISNMESERKIGQQSDNKLGLAQWISSKDFEKFIKIVSPFIPHVAEEIWKEKLSHNKSIFLESWPKYNPALIKDEEIELVIQVNGKLRDWIMVPAEISAEEAKKLALESEKIKNIVTGKEIKKVIFVKGKLINIVIK